MRLFSYFTFLNPKVFEEKNQIKSLILKQIKSVKIMVSRPGVVLRVEVLGKVVVRFGRLQRFVVLVAVDVLVNQTKL